MVVALTELPVEEEPIRVLQQEGVLAVKPLKLEDVGFLRAEPTLINCPACQALAVSVVRTETVTSVQRLLGWTSCGKTWSGRHDINHYCAKCGCFIGRHRPLGRLELCVENYARRQAAHGTMTLKEPHVDCGQMATGWRKQWQADRARKKADRAAAEAAKETAKMEVAKPSN